VSLKSHHFSRLTRPARWHKQECCGQAAAIDIAKPHQEGQPVNVQSFSTIVNGDKYEQEE
jgi:hypothetical protein